MVKHKYPLVARIWRIIKAVTLFFFISTILVSLIYRFVPPPVTPLMLMRVIEQLAEGTELKLDKSWVSYDEISPNLVRAVITSEDNNFLEHYGIDFEAIEKARKLNEHGKKLRGASTISQQTAKNVFLWPGRNYIRKGLEVYFTYLIEITWSKQRIMEVYLNDIEMGNGIYGAEMASQTYFHKPAVDLTRSEAALIAAVLPNPRKWSPAHPTPYIMRKKNWILGRMNKFRNPE
ncbi:MAG: monofunctional biosynthetic peptidoglycan transglycosylase [Bacteroidales bacterium]